MNRDQKAAFIDDVAQRVEASEAIFAINYRGITVSQVAELRGKLGEAGASFQVVKNTLTRLALDRTGDTTLKEFLEGPTAFTYVTGDVAAAAKTIADFKKENEILDFKGGIMEGQIVTVEQFTTLTKLPSRQVLYGQLVGLVASPISGLARTLNALVGGLAIQLGAIRDQGLVTGEAPAASVAEVAPVAEEAPAEEAPDSEEPPAENAASDDEPSDAPAASAEEEASAEGGDESSSDDDPGSDPDADDE